MWIGVVSLIPGIFSAIQEYGITSQAIKNGFLKLRYWNPRDFVEKKGSRNYCSVDGPPYGGGKGMFIKFQPLCNAIHAAKVESKDKHIKVIYFTPQGRKLNPNTIKNIIANRKKIILVCGRYSGIDERLISSEVDEELSIGDYVLSGGELPAMVLIDSISRFIPGVLNKEIHSRDCFSYGFLSYPQYTRPRTLNRLSVPSILLSGNHENIRRWRLKQALGRTWLRRPDLLDTIILTQEQKRLLDEFKKEHIHDINHKVRKDK